MSGRVLRKAEIQELTGCKQRAACIRVLTQQRVPFVIAADGWPRVHEAALLGPNVVRIPKRDEQEPDLDALAS